MHITLFVDMSHWWA